MYTYGFWYLDKQARISISQLDALTTAQHLPHLPDALDCTNGSCI